MRTYVLIIGLLLLTGSTLSSLNMDDLRFIHQKELWHIFERNIDPVSIMMQESADNPYFYTVFMDYYRAKGDTISYSRMLFQKAKTLHDLPAAYQYIHLDLNNDEYRAQCDFLRDIEFSREDISQTLILAMERELPDSLRELRIEKLLSAYGTANEILADFAKEKVDAIAVERNDSLRIEMIDRLLRILPESEWTPSLEYFRVSAMTNLKQYAQVIDALSSIRQTSNIRRYASVRAMLNGDLLDYLAADDDPSALRRFLDQAEFMNNQILESLSNRDSVRFMYQNLSPEDFRRKATLLQATLTYLRLKYDLIAQDEIEGNIRRSVEALQAIHYKNNDAGEQAEVAFWKGRLLAMSGNGDTKLEAASELIQCLALGAPRKRYDEKAFDILEDIHKELGIESDIMLWARNIAGYSDIVFEDITIEAGLSESRESRVAFGDFDNDGDEDLLLSGRKLWRNNGNMTFTDVTEKSRLQPNGASGGLWADCNMDGYLDIAVTSHADKAPSDVLYKAMGTGFFPEADTTISDPYPTEGAAWTDLDLDGYPELYLASYEIGGKYIGLPDFFFSNNRGNLIDTSEIIGIRTMYDDSLNAQAGRGIAPADYDNDGVQEILVCNYRLDRNFLFDYDPQTGRLSDIAALEGLAGNNVDGWYGHSIGADWGDYDNDGDLDLFIANLAHPRYIEFSDISVLFRNDGKTWRVIDGETIEYTQFTDVTEEAGIAYDELHSDPTWFDADNDGDLDLYITSIYQNDRSYMYRNNGDGTFSDITWLSGCRVYNGWGNAVADIDLDGRLDICVGSGSGVKLFHNVTRNPNRSISFKPFWNENTPAMVPQSGWKRFLPNSPLLGARIVLTVNDPQIGKYRIMRELSSAKGTTSQNSQFLHFGFGEGQLIKAQLLHKNRQVQEITY